MDPTMICIGIQQKKGQITIPRHGSKELAKGTEESILKTARLK